MAVTMGNSCMNKAVLDSISDPDCYEFVQKPPDYLQLKCPVCFEILLPEPYLVSCCGNHFCKKCIETIGKHEPCPLCKAKYNAQFKVPDIGLAKTLNSLIVYCPNKAKSCDWNGEVGFLCNHLSTTCGFVIVPCKYNCGSSIIRNELKIHESQRCPQRPQTCNHCKLYSATYVQVFQHERKCPKAIVNCPNNCDGTFHREEVSNHLQDCPNVLKNCMFKYAGCDWADTVRKHDDHLQNFWMHHMSLVSTHITQTVKDQDKIIVTLTTKMKKQEGIIKDLTAQVENLKTCSNLPPIGVSPKPTACSKPTDCLLSTVNRKSDVSSQSSSQHINSESIVSSKSVASPQSSTASSRYPVASEIVLPFVPVDRRTLRFSIDRFQWRKSKNCTHYSPAFKLSNSRFFMQLTFYFNGVKKGKGTHISVYINLVSSEYKKWLASPPVSHHFKVLVRLRSQDKRCYHHEEVISIAEESLVASSESFASPNGKLNGIATFIAHTQMVPFLERDCLSFELPQIII